MSDILYGYGVFDNGFVAVYYVICPKLSYSEWDIVLQREAVDVETVSIHVYANIYICILTETKGTKWKGVYKFKGYDLVWASCNMFYSNDYMRAGGGVGLQILAETGWVPGSNVCTARLVDMNADGKNPSSNRAIFYATVTFWPNS